MGPSSGPPDHRAGARLIGAAVRVRWRALLLALCGSVGHTASHLVAPLIAMHAINHAIDTHSTDGLPTTVALLAGVAVARGGFGGLRKYNASRLGALVGTDLRSSLFEQLQRLSASYYERVGAGQLMSRVSSDALVIDTAVGNLPFLVQSLLMAVGGVIILVLLQPLLGAAVSAAVVLLSVLPLRFSAPMQHSAQRLADANGEVTSVVEQQVRGLRVIKGLGLETVRSAAADEAIDRLAEQTRRVVSLRATFVAAFVSIPSVAVILTLSLGSWLATRDELTPGELLAFLGYLGVLVGLVPAVQQLLTSWPAAFASGARVAQVLDSTPDVVSPEQPLVLPPGPGALSFRGVTFGYVPGQPVLNSLDLEVEGGASLALVGLSGSGKTTVVRLLLRTHDVWSGSISLDGVPVDRLGLATLRRSAAIVFEEPITFSGSVRDNIAMGHPQADDAQVEEAARLALVDGFVQDLPNGYDTQLGEQGMLLSGGQRQRLSVARAIVRSPRVLLLDDATSALDPDSQYALGESLRAVMRGRTTLMISHRVETVLLAEEVAVLDRGRVVARGPSGEMLSHPALRSALHLDQVAVAP